MDQQPDRTGSEWSAAVGSGPVETTLYSLSEEPPAPMETRRKSERYMTLFRVGALIVDGRRELCLIKNISAGGMMIRAYCALFPEQQVKVELKNGQPVSGTISWAREQQVGVTFDQPIDVLAILANDEDGLRPRMPRIETDATIYVREGASTYRVRACDISQGGVKVEGAAALTGGASVVVSLPGLQPQPALVRWSDGGCAGISFNRPLSLPSLVEWLDGQRGSARAA